MKKLKPLIVCVDDEKFVLDIIQKQLQNHFKDEFEYEFAESASEAFEIIEEQMKESERVVMVITDQIMPGMTGDEFLSQLYHKYAGVITILLTGQASIASAVNVINNAHLYRYLTKPWEEADLMLTVEKGLEQYNLNKVSERQMEQFCKFVPRAFLEHLSKNMLDVELGNSVEKEMVVLFTDIKGFTSLAETLSPQECYNFINAYLQMIEPAISLNKGFIDKYIGDAVMALFSNAEDAIAAGIAIQKKLQEHNLKKNGTVQSIRSTIGMHIGELMLGIVGVPGRLQGTVISDAVNIASRLQGLTSIYGSSIIITKDLMDRLSNKDQYVFRFLGKVNVVGKTKVVPIYDLLDAEPEDIRQIRMKYCQEFEAGLDLYFQRKFAEAAVKFYSIHEQDREDKAALLYLKKISGYLCDPPPEKWDGVESILTK